MEVGFLSEQSPIAWRYCGHQFKMWRQEAGVSREDVGKESNYSPDTITSFERGVRRPTARLLDIGDELFGARGKLKAAAQYLEPEKFPPRTQDFMDCEASAIALQWYETLLIPGLLQAESYVRALLGAHYPPLDDETIESRVAARLERQQLLVRKPTAYFGFVFEEIALRRPVGGSATMREQCQRLLKVGQLRNVSIQVLPTDRGAHAGLNGPMVLIETPEREHYAYEEGQAVSMLHSGSEDLSNLTQRFGMIRTQALSTEESARFIGKVADEW
ncbi:helix-turn-helix domain-containing protein [Streptomyces sp. NPDC050988]|uniref:helix-turn-helix domain-containing protein n=1 Tax=Streptomyces sp. NPDC050988 TaxID=3365637 RepID=UPI00378B70DA